MYKSQGFIKGSEASQKPGWFYLSVDPEIADYYNWFCRKAFRGWNPCMNGPHITFIAGEKDDRIVSLQELSPFMKEQISFSYENLVLTNGRAFWFKCYAPRLNEIRKELGLKERSFIHLTLGNWK